MYLMPTSCIMTMSSVNISGDPLPSIAFADDPLHCMDFSDDALPCLSSVPL